MTAPRRHLARIDSSRVVSLHPAGRVLRSVAAVAPVDEHVVTLRADLGVCKGTNADGGVRHTDEALALAALLVRVDVVDEDVGKAVRLTGVLESHKHDRLIVPRHVLMGLGIEAVTV